MSEDQVAWRHHYVPQFYLSAWAVDGFLRQYSWAPNGRLIEKDRVATKATGFVENLYSVAADQPDDEIEKKVFRQLDTLAAPVHRKMLVDGAPQLELEDLRVWAAFINAQLEREARVLGGRDEVGLVHAQELIAELRATRVENPERLERALAQVDAATLVRTASRSFMVQQVKNLDFAEHLARQRWTFVDPPQGREFITCDEPVVVNAGTKPDRPVEFLTMAIGPARMLLITPTDPTDDQAGQLALIHSLAVAGGGSTYVYARAPIVDAPWGGSEVRLRSLLEERRLRSDRTK